MSVSPFMNSLPAAAIDWIEHATASSVDSSAPMPGATTSAVHLVTLTSGAELVIRRHVWQAFLDEEPDRVEHEAHALRILQATEVPAPELVAADRTGTTCDVPALLMTRLAGQPGTSIEQGRLALSAAAIAAVPPNDTPWRYRPYNEGVEMWPPSWATDRRAWELVIEAAAVVPSGPVVFAHRDFHPWNVLAEGDRISGVVDWLSACLGPWQADVAHCRLNLILWTGSAEPFTTAYESATERTFDPVWDAIFAMDALPYSDPRDVDDWTGFAQLGLTPPQARERMNRHIEATAARL